jgi:hypothetical protein
MHKLILKFELFDFASYRLFGKKKKKKKKLLKASTELFCFETTKD